MKQISPNINHSVPFQPYGQMMQWMPYHQVPAQLPNPGVLAETTQSSGLMGLLKKLNPLSGNLGETLDQIQTIVKMTQSITPKIQQYGPLIKNLPNMLALMKEFNDSEDDEQTDHESTDDEKDSTDELDKILGIQQSDEEEKSNDIPLKQAYENNQTTDNIGDNLFKIEALNDQEKPEYNAPTLYI